ncbi:NAD(P)-dependent alcohol dehydrogenase [Paracoccus pantotrophus]|uniref:NAD(P)-dependent alcohol dehydrogenase n=1 Tax=Paracoccus pantotrophus TaxID=82367 RepID=UPI0004908D15|nr:NAD(P)-dependent alcohol dehydrogenase [Paracoccus pantotrophus]
MTLVKARCTCAAHAPFKPMIIERRELGPHDVMIDIAFAGICHSDIHYAYDEFGRTTYPLVPGHEIAGIVSRIGSDVSRYQVGDRVGVGVMVDSCRNCRACKAGHEQYCTGKRVMTYNSVGRDGKPTYGGYSQKIVVDENYVVRIPESIPLDRAAPMFCAGVTVYSPLRHWSAGPGKTVAILGFGGLGHLGVQIAHAMGAEVIVLDIAESKRDDAMRFGAREFRIVTDPRTFRDLAGRIDLIISTVPVDIDLNEYAGLLALDGTFVNTGVPPKPLAVDATNLLTNRRSVAGTRSGGIAETQEMMDFCALHGIGAEVEIISADQIDEAYARVLRGDVKFRFVIDTNTLQ